MKAWTQTDTLTPRFIASLSTIGKSRDSPYCPLIGLMGKQNVVLYTYAVQYYVAFKINSNLIHATAWISLEDIELSGVSLTQKDRYMSSVK